MKTKLLFFLTLSLITINAKAVPPPYIAFKTGENLFFEGKTCGQIAKRVLEEAGFKRVTKSGETDVLAAYRKTKRYQYKVLISCLPKYGLVRVVVVTEFSGRGADKAEQLLGKMKQALKVNDNSILDKKEKYQKGEQNFQKGNQYYRGKTVPQDFTEAVKWYQKAAEQGHYQAQYELGMMYYQGQQVPQDFVKSYTWLLLASAQGKKEAVKARDEVIARLSLNQIEEAQQMARIFYETYTK